MQAVKSLAILIFAGAIRFPIVLFAPPAYSQDVQVTASVDPDTVGVNDSLELTITISGRDSGDAGAPRLPRFKGFQVAGQPGTSTRFQWINGQASSSKTFTYTLIPEKEGVYILDPVEVSAGGKIYRTQPITVRVSSQSNRPSSSRNRTFDPFGLGITRRQGGRVGDEVFVEVELDRSTAYPGQQVTVYYHLYTQVGVTGLQLQENPPLTGFWVEDLQVDSSPTATRRIIDGREYLDYVVKKQALFPNAPGKLKIPPSTFAISVRTAGSDFFSFLGQTETVYRKTKEVGLEVEALPSSGKPANFSNAVGSFTLTTSIDKSRAATGDAVSLRINLAGRGNLKMISELPLSPLPDFTIYPAKNTENVRSFEGDIIGGDKTWEHVIVPKAPGDQKIPALTFSYFDPKHGKYETISTPALDLQVVRGVDTGGLLTALSGINKQPLTKQASDIHFIKLAADDLEAPGEPPYESLWFYVLALGPLLWSTGAFLYQRERLREGANLPLVRSRKARKSAFARLRNAEKEGRTDPRRFYDGAAAALSGYLTDRFNLPEIAVTGDTLERALREQRIAEETIQEITAAIQECDFARFVSAGSDPGKMRGLSARIRRVIDSVEQI